MTACVLRKHLLSFAPRGNVKISINKLVMIIIVVLLCVEIVPSIVVDCIGWEVLIHVS